MLARLGLWKQRQAVTPRRPTGRRFVALELLALAVTCFSLAMQAAQNSPSDRQSSGGLMTLRGNTRPEAQAANDRGRVADDFPMNHMTLLLRRPAEQEEALEKFLHLEPQRDADAERDLKETEVGAAEVVQPDTR